MNIAAGSFDWKKKQDLVIFKKLTTNLLKLISLDFFSKSQYIINDLHETWHQLFFNSYYTLRNKNGSKSFKRILFCFVFFRIALNK